MQMDSMGRLPLHHLCERIPCPTACDIITLLGAAPSTGMVRDLRGNTPLHLLCMSRATEAAVATREVSRSNTNVGLFERLVNIDNPGDAAEGKMTTTKSGAAHAKRFAGAVMACVAVALPVYSWISARAALLSF